MKRIAFAAVMLIGFHVTGQEMTESPFGVEAAGIEWDLRCFPNPTSDLLMVKSSKEIKSIEFYDINGKELKLPALPNNCFSLNELPAGWVFLLIESTDGFYERKSVYKH